MKKVLLTVSFAAITGLIFGQTSGISSKTFPRKDAKSVFVGTSTAEVNNNAERAVIWSNDFATPSDWTATNTGTPPANWVIGTAAPTGQYSSGMGAITSTTAANNFALFDSDALGSGTSTQNASLKVTNPIDLSASPAVLVEFQSYYRAFQRDCFLETSTDGTNWTSYPVHADLAVNDATDNPVTVSINATGSIGGASTAYIRFRYEGGWDYAWMVDDVQIVDAPANDLVLGNVFYGEYSQYPIGQEMPIEFSGKVTNNGAAAQTNVTLAVSVNGTNFATSTPVASFAVGATDSLVVPGAYTPSGAGTYTLAFTVDQDETDANPATNTTTRTVAVSQYTFARDNNNYTGAGLWNQAGNAYIMGNLFALTNEAEATSIDVILQGNTVAGAQFRVLLLDELVDGTPDDGIVAESDFYTVDAADISSGTSTVVVKVPFIAPVDIAAGEYIAAIDFQGGSDDLVLAAGSDIIQPIQTTFIYDTDGVWYYMTSTPMVRLNINEPNSNSIKEEATSSIAVFPNPASDVVNVKFAGINGDVTLQMFSTDGKQVMARNTNVVAGQNLTLDISGLSAGVYTLRVNGTNGAYTQKVVVK